MREEIFGPVLPIKTYSWLDEAIDYVNRRPRPLALYYFGADATKRDEVLRKTHLRRRRSQYDTVSHRGGKPAVRRHWRLGHRRLSRRVRVPDLLAPQGRSAAEPPQRLTLPASAVRPRRRPDAEISQPLTSRSRRRSKFHRDRRLVSPARPRESGTQRIYRDAGASSLHIRLRGNERKVQLPRYSAAWRDGGCTLASPSTSAAEIVVRTMNRASCAGHGRPRCIVARLSHMTTSPLRQVWT